MQTLRIYVTAKNIPNDDTKTTPNPAASGPPMFKNFSLGADIATKDKPKIVQKFR